MQKVCRYCKIEKDEKEFTSNYKGLPQSYCKECQRKIQFTKRNERRKQGTCTHCGGETQGGKKVCEKCASYSREIKRRNKLMAVKYLGGCCKICGLESNMVAVYDFHHRDPLEKEGNIGRLVSKNWEDLRKEIEKCDLLCSNCHRILHYHEEK